MRQFDIREAIEKRRIVSFSDGPKVVSKEIKTAKQDLKDAKETFERDRFKWATIQAYYAIFHASRALLYKKRYREKSHFYLGQAIKSLYITETVTLQYSVKLGLCPVVNRLRGNYP